MKGLVVALNGSESNPALLAATKAKVTGPRAQVCELSAKTEAEVAQIEDPKERAEFLTALGITEPALHVLTRQLYKALGYISFFTTGEGKRVRAWNIGTARPPSKTAHVPQRHRQGFIRAERR
jgi:ribosome-binding ATPase YchF (GTP1/OBG family)